MHQIQQDTEVTLSTGKLLAIFFGLVVICGIFFSLGYGIGKNSSPAASSPILDSSTLSNVAVSGGSKRGAVKATPPAADPSAAAATTTNPSANASDTSTATAAANSASSRNNAVSRGGSQPAASSSTSDSRAASSRARSADATPELHTADLHTTGSASASSDSAGFMVQVAAVSKQEDAEALVAALRKKQYPVFMVNNTASHLYHVQVGPFPDQKDAESMRSKLSTDGYNAILKH